MNSQDDPFEGDARKRTCRFCGKVALRRFFCYAGTSRYYRLGTCLECKDKKTKAYTRSEVNRARAAKYRENNRVLCQERCARANAHRTTEEGRRKRADVRLRSLYGISLDAYEKMNIEQAGRCAICGREPSIVWAINKLVVDHCHRTKTTRGLICARCNRGLGSFEDSARSLRAAAAYLEKYALFNPTTA